jgi:hypothetical protein
MTDNLDLIAGSAPSAESAPQAVPYDVLDIPAPPGGVLQPATVSLSEALGLTDADLVEAGIMSPPAPRVRKYTPCTGSQITTFLKAANAGMKEPHFASEDEVEAFVKERGL